MLFELAVDGDQYAQPLYMGGLTMPDGKKHNVVFVATSHDSVYAFDADDATSMTPLWHQSIGTSTQLPSPYLSFEWATPPPRCSDFNMNESGITATPVIDPKTSTIYVLALNVDMTQTTPGGTCLNTTTCALMTCNAPKLTYQLHALDLFTGGEKFGGPVDVSGTFKGSGAGSQSGVLTFDPGVSLARPALFLQNGTVYFATGSYVDAGNYHGWMFAYDAATLKQTGVFVDTPNGVQAGIWQSGRGFIADAAGNLYIVTGQGTFDGLVNGMTDWGDSLLKMSADLSTVNDYFSPYYSDYMGNNFPKDWDDDLGSAGATLIPNTQLILITGKMGMSYLTDTNSLGKWSAGGEDNVVQRMRLTWRPGTSCAGNMHGPEAWVYATPITWVGPDGTHVYVWADNDYLRDYLLDGSGKFQDSGQICWCNPWSVSGSDGPINLPADPDCAATNTQGNVTGNASSTGGAVAISSNGSEKGSGILWATYANPTAGTPLTMSTPGYIAAYDATNVSTPIWISSDNTNDTLGDWAKFTPPTVANGKVYAATFSNKLVVYGLLTK
jgi:hypothetical protein